MCTQSLGNEPQMWLGLYAAPASNWAYSLATTCKNLYMHSRGDKQHPSVVEVSACVSLKLLTSESLIAFLHSLYTQATDGPALPIDGAAVEAGSDWRAFKRVNVSRSHLSFYKAQCKSRRIVLWWFKINYTFWGRQSHYSGIISAGSLSEYGTDVADTCYRMMEFKGGGWERMVSIEIIRATEQTYLNVPIRASAPD